MFDGPLPPRLELDPIPEAQLYPPRLRDAEERRRPIRKIGIALSGGGIRSATLSLGFFQALADRRGFLALVDYLSTVSGGGYFGGFLVHLMHRPAAASVKDPNATDEEKRLTEGDPFAAPPPADPAGWPEAVLMDRRSRAIGYLRRNGRYLTPNGTGDMMMAAAVALRNWISVLVVVAFLALAGLAALTWSRYSLAALPRFHDAMIPIVVPGTTFYVSPWVRLIALIFVFLAVPTGWAYWLVKDSRQTRPVLQAIGRWLGPGVSLAALLAWRMRWLDPDATAPVLRLAAAVGAVTAVLWFAYRFRSAEEQRYFHSRNLARTLVLLVATSMVVAVDSIGQTFATHWPVITATSGGLLALLGLGRERLIRFATTPRPGRGPAVPLGALATVIAIVIAIALLGALATVPYTLLQTPDATYIAPPTTVDAALLDRLLLLAAAMVALTLAIGVLRPFVNRSSLHSFYEARLRRAYLGASNAVRHTTGKSTLPDSEPHPDDGLRFDRYLDRPQRGPIHLINVTVNESIDGRTQTLHRDRKGIPLAVGPAGVSASRTHHALWHKASARGVLEEMRSGVAGAWDRALRTVHLRKGESATPSFRIFHAPAAPEVLDPSQWIAISGAAVSTGLGAQTSLGFSLLLGLFNVRLGYWWRSGLDPAARRGATTRTWLQSTLAVARGLLPVQTSLLTEWFARFTGPARTEWNLTDGGHFENLGAYELLRRRLRFMIVCDFEQDAAYEFNGLSNLVLKARVDLDATIEFLTDDEIARTRAADATPAALKAAGLPEVRLPRDIGSLEALRRGYRTSESMPAGHPYRARSINDGDERATSFVHAAIARVTYGSSRGEAAPVAQEDGPAWLLYVKSSLSGDESADIMQYHSANPSFPHQSTADQFFDEAQWESYRALGEHLGQRLVADEPAFAAWIDGFHR